MAKPAFIAKTFTAGIPDKDPMKKTVASVDAHNSIDGPPRPNTLEITSVVVSLSRWCHFCNFPIFD